MEAAGQSELGASVGKEEEPVLGFRNDTDALPSPPETLQVLRWAVPAAHPCHRQAATPEAG